MTLQDIRPILAYSRAHASDWLLLAEELQLAGIEWRVLDILDNLTDYPTGIQEVLAAVREWDVVREVPAVRLGQVQVFTEDYVTVPGPRFVLLLEHMAEVIATARTNPPAKAGERSP